MGPWFAFNVLLEASWLKGNVEHTLHFAHHVEIQGVVLNFIISVLPFSFIVS